MRQIVVSSAVSGSPDRAIFAGSSFEIVTEEAIDSACRCRFQPETAGEVGTLR